VKLTSFSVIETQLQRRAGLAKISRRPCRPDESSGNALWSLDPDFRVDYL